MIFAPWRFLGILNLALAEKQSRSEDGPPERFRS